MLIFDKCCCFRLREGCIIRVVVEFFAVNLFWIIASNYSSGYFSASLDTSKYGGPNGISTYYILVGGNVLIWIACCCLIWGACKCSQIATVIYLVLEMIKIALVVTAVVFWVLYLDEAEEDQEVNDILTVVFVSAGFISAFMLSIYFWCCVYNFYLKMKRDEICAPLWIWSMSPTE